MRLRAVARFGGGVLYGGLARFAGHFTQIAERFAHELFYFCTVLPERRAAGVALAGWWWSVCWCCLLRTARYVAMNIRPARALTNREVNTH